MTAFRKRIYNHSEYLLTIATGRDTVDFRYYINCIDNDHFWNTRKEYFKITKTPMSEINFSWINLRDKIKNSIKYASKGMRKTTLDKLNNLLEIVNIELDNQKQEYDNKQSEIESSGDVQEDNNMNETQNNNAKEYRMTEFRKKVYTAVERQINKLDDKYKNCPELGINNIYDDKFWELRFEFYSIIKMPLHICPYELSVDDGIYSWAWLKRSTEDYINLIDYYSERDRLKMLLNEINKYMPKQEENDKQVIEKEEIKIATPEEKAQKITKISIKREIFEKALKKSLPQISKDETRTMMTCLWVCLFPEHERMQIMATDGRQLSLLTLNSSGQEEEKHEIIDLDSTPVKYLRIDNPKNVLKAIKERPKQEEIFIEKIEQNENVITKIWSDDNLLQEISFYSDCISQQPPKYSRIPQLKDAKLTCYYDNHSIKNDSSELKSHFKLANPVKEAYTLSFPSGRISTTTKDTEVSTTLEGFYRNDINLDISINPKFLINGFKFVNIEFHEDIKISLIDSNNPIFIHLPKRPSWFYMFAPMHKN